VNRDEIAHARVRRTPRVPFSTNDDLLITMAGRMTTGDIS
jgi:hypothetical protein